MPIGAVIFDFNGVLVNDELVHYSLFKEVLAQEGVTLSEEDYHDRYLGYDDRRCLEAALQDAGRSPYPQLLDRLIAQKARRYLETADQGLQFFPAAAETLETIAERWPVAICSGALRSEIEYGLRRLGRYDHVAAIISAEDTSKCKPDPEGYHLALVALRAHVLDRQRHAIPGATQQNMWLDVTAGNCLVIEDSLAGIVSARSAGMKAVGVSNTYSAPELLEAGADDVVDGLGTLTVTWIEGRFAS